MDIALLAISMLTVLAAGGNILFLIMFLAKKDGLYFLEKAALAYGMGLAAISLEMLIMHLANLRFDLKLIIAPWVLLAVVNAVLYAAKGKKILNDPVKGASRGPGMPALRVILAILLGAEVICASFKALIKPLESYDALAIYGIKAKLFFMQSAIPADFFSKLCHSFPHPDYPLNIPLSETFIYLFLGSLNDQLVKIIFPLYFIALLAVFFSSIRRFAGSAYALLFTFIVASVPMLNDYAANGYLDLILAFYVFSGAAFLFAWFKDTRSTHYLIISAVMSACAAWTKNEGLMYLGISVAVMIAFFALDDRRRLASKAGSLVLYALIVSAISAPWMLIKWHYCLVNTDIGSIGASPVGVLRQLHKIGPILYEFQKQVLGPKKWNILWPLFLFAVIFRYRKLLESPARYAALFLALSVSGYVFVYLSSPLDINFFLSKTWARFLLHFLPVAVYLMAYVLKDDISL